MAGILAGWHGGLLSGTGSWDLRGMLHTANPTNTASNWTQIWLNAVGSAKLVPSDPFKSSIIFFFKSSFVLNTNLIPLLTNEVLILQATKQCWLVIREAVHRREQVGIETWAILSGSCPPTVGVGKSKSRYNVIQHHQHGISGWKLKEELMILIFCFVWQRTQPLHMGPADSWGMLRRTQEEGLEERTSSLEIQIHTMSLPTSASLAKSFYFSEPATHPYDATYHSSSKTAMQVKECCAPSSRVNNTRLH